MRDLSGITGWLEECRDQMRDPGRVVKAVIVDDDILCIKGTKMVLESWPNIEVQVVAINPSLTLRAPEIPADVDIAILDHDLRSLEYSGATLLEDMVQKGFVGQVISATVLDTSYGHFRFTHKDKLRYERKFFDEFIAIINSAIDALTV